MILNMRTLEGVDGGGAGNFSPEVSAAMPTTGAGPSPKMLTFEGLTITSLSIGAYVSPPMDLSTHVLLSPAYYLVVFVLSLLGVQLMVLSVVVVGNPKRRAMAKVLMGVTPVLLTLLMFLCTVGNPIFKHGFLTL